MRPRRPEALLATANRRAQREGVNGRVLGFQGCSCLYAEGVSRTVYKSGSISC